jgi:hypothetical protein
VNDVNTNEVNVNPKAGADQKGGFDIPLFAMPFMGSPSKAWRGPRKIARK